MLHISDALRGQFDGILRVLPKVRETLRAKTDVVAVRPGYDCGAGQTATPAVMIAVVPGTAPVEQGPRSRRSAFPS